MLSIMWIRFIDVAVTELSAVKTMLITVQAQQPESRRHRNVLHALRKYGFHKPVTYLFIFFKLKCAYRAELWCSKESRVQALL